MIVNHLEKYRVGQRMFDCELESDDPVIRANHEFQASMKSNENNKAKKMN